LGPQDGFGILNFESNLDSRNELIERPDRDLKIDADDDGSAQTYRGTLLIHRYLYCTFTAQVAPMPLRYR